MLQLSAALLNKPVLSLRTGSPVATTTTPIINPDNLKIEGFYCIDNRTKQLLVLVYQDVRELIPQGFIVNDYDALEEPKDLVRLHKFMDINFDPLGKQVFTVSKKRVGKVNDYATEIESMYIQKLYVGQSLIKSLAGGSLSVDRTQIHEITPKKIVIQDLLGTVPAGVPA